MRSFILFLVIIVAVSIVAQEDRAVMQSRISATQEIIQATNAGWQAGETAMSRLSVYDFQERLGLVLNDDSGRDQVEIGETFIDTRDLPNYVNWYEKGYITSIKDQGHCGSCYAFASCALLESFYAQHHNQKLDLSEQYFMMKTKIANLFGGCKGNNLWVCAAACLAFGAPEESCCPYKAVDEDCPISCPRNYRAGCLVTGEVAGFQKMLAEHGPIVAGFLVYDDFRDYESGVYKHVQGSFLGGHAILIVGYNKEQQYWIVKNSWGTDWGETCDGKGQGERGYFRIGFGECMIEMPYMGPFYAPHP